MASRLELHEELCNNLGSREVYFQPPESINMQYPAIVYSRKNINNTFANNDVYHQDPCYEICVIDPDPDSDIVSRISQMKRIRHDRHYKADNLNHDVFTLYY